MLPGRGSFGKVLQGTSPVRDPLGGEEVGGKTSHKRTWKGKIRRTDAWKYLAFLKSIYKREKGGEVKEAEGTSKLLRRRPCPARRKLSSEHTMWATRSPV